MAIYCTAQGIQPICYNNFKWSIIYKNIKSLCGSPETNIVNQLYFNEKSQNFASFGLFRYCIESGPLAFYLKSVFLYFPPSVQNALSCPWLWDEISLNSFLCSDLLTRVKGVYFNVHSMIFFLDLSFFPMTQLNAT